MVQKMAYDMARYIPYDKDYTAYKLNKIFLDAMTKEKQPIILKQF